MPEKKSSYAKEYKDEYMLHAKVNRKYKIYAVFKTGFFLNSLKKSKHLVFSVNTPFNYAHLSKDKCRMDSDQITAIFKLLSYCAVSCASVFACSVRIKYKLPIIFIT